MHIGSGRETKFFDQIISVLIHIPCNLLESSLAAAAKGSKGDGSELLEEEEGPSPDSAPPPALPDGGTPPDLASLLELLDFELLALSSPGGTV